MNLRASILLSALVALAACATQEEPKPAAQPAPEPAAPAPAPVAAPAPAEAPKAEPVKPVAEKTRMAAHVLFDFDKATLRPEGRSALDEFAANARGVELDTLIVTGHADRIGTEDYNQRLSLRRATTVRSYLVGKGFSAGRVYAEGKGESQPVTGDACRKMGAETRSNRKLVACLQPDRRVEFELIGTRTRP